MTESEANDINEISNKTKEIDSYRFRVSEQIQRVFEAGSEDIINDPQAMAKYQRSIKQLEIALSPVTDHKPYLKEGEKEHTVSFTTILNRINEDETLTNEERFDLVQRACIGRLEDIGMMPTKIRKDKDIGTTDDFRDWIKHKFPQLKWK